MTVALLKPDTHQDCTKQTKMPRLKMLRVVPPSLYKVPRESHASALQEQPDVMEPLYTRQQQLTLGVGGGMAASPPIAAVAMTSQIRAAKHLVSLKPRGSKVALEKFRLLFALLKVAGKGSVSGHFVACICSFG